jgi:hypothetical protein
MSDLLRETEQGVVFSGILRRRIQHVVRIAMEPGNTPEQAYELVDKHFPQDPEEMTVGFQYSTIEPEGAAGVPGFNNIGGLKGQ